MHSGRLRRYRGALRAYDAPEPGGLSRRGDGTSWPPRLPSLTEWLTKKKIQPPTLDPPTLPC